MMDICDLSGWCNYKYIQGQNWYLVKNYEFKLLILVFLCCFKGFKGFKGFKVDFQIWC